MIVYFAVSYLAQQPLATGIVMLGVAFGGGYQVGRGMDVRGGVHNGCKFFIGLNWWVDYNWKLDLIY